MLVWLFCCFLPRKFWVVWFSVCMHPRRTLRGQASSYLYNMMSICRSIWRWGWKLPAWACRSAERAGRPFFGVIYRDGARHTWDRDDYSLRAKTTAPVFRDAICSSNKFITKTYSVINLIILIIHHSQTLIVFCIYLIKLKTFNFSKSKNNTLYLLKRGSIVSREQASKKAIEESLLIHTKFILYLYLKVPWLFRCNS